jgi:hypothetical protein
MSTNLFWSNNAISTFKYGHLRVFFGGGFFFAPEDNALGFGVLLNGQRLVIMVVLGLGRQLPRLGEMEVSSLLATAHGRAF